MTSFKVRNLDETDLQRLAWSGGKRHLEYLKEWFDRSKTGSLEVLGLEVEGDLIGICYIDYERVESVGTLSALSIKEEFRSKGYGTLLIEAAQERVKERKLDAMELRVEISNPKAIALYERLGYKKRGESVESWEQYDSKGNIEVYTTKAFVMRKSFS